MNKINSILKENCDLRLQINNINKINTLIIYIKILYKI